MKTDAWAFLVSRNQSVDYKTVVAPDFIDAAKLRSLLTKVTEGGLTYDTASIRQVERRVIGDCWIVFRVVEAIAADIEKVGRETLKDSFGRDIYLVEGFVIRKRERPSFLEKTIMSSYLEQVHTKVRTHYKDFWYTNKTAVSNCFSLQEGTSGRTLTLVEQPPDRESPLLKKPGKPDKPGRETPQLSLNFLLILATATIVTILLSALFRPIFGGSDLIGRSQINQGCSYVTQLQTIPYGESKEWLKTLEDLEKKNKPATLFINTVTPDQSSATQGIQGQEEPTFKQDNDGTIQMKFHPFQQAIKQLRNDSNSKLANNTTLEVRIIKSVQNDKDQCLRNLYTS